jgi:hypothetical protein
VARFSWRVLCNFSPCSLLKAARPEWLPDKVRAGPGVPPSSFFWSVREKVLRVVDAPTSMTLSLFFCLGSGQIPHDALTSIFRISMEDLDASLTTSSATVCLWAPLTFLLLSVFLFPRHSCCFRPGFLCHCYISAAPIISSRTSVLYAFLVQNCPCLVPNTTVSLARCRSTVLRQQPTSAGTHQHSGSVSSAVGGTLQLDACPHIGPPVLRLFSTRPLP